MKQRLRRHDDLGTWTSTRPRSPGGAPVDLKRLEDDRGFFIRVLRAGVRRREPTPRSPSATSRTTTRRARCADFTHQLEPNAEVKVIRCVRSAIFDVIVDLRFDSDTYLQWFGAELSQDNYRANVRARGTSRTPT
ncbi:dTDP-4-keto-6-deoxy-D-glucose epimerase [Pseudonocardia sp. MCCB 268]|nr:dTDP-4-keto-6-deoxy-D-glucose epimerase [Pseudonocardia cytotoxica]